MARRDKDQPPRTFPRWLSWVVLLFLAYILYEGNFVAPHREQRSTAPGVAAPARDYPQLRTVTDADRWKRALNPDYVSDVKMHDIAEGDGEGARCGEEITIALRGTTSEGAGFDPAHKDDAPLTFRLGAAPYPALDNALLGLKPGGKRRVDAPPQLVYKDAPHKTSDTILLYVERTDHPAPLPRDRLQLQWSDDEPGEGPGAACGETVHLVLIVWNDKGEWAFDPPKGSHRIKLGEGGLETYALDAALVGLAKGGTRTIVLPPMSDKDRAPTDAVWKPWHDVLAAHRVTVVTVVRTKEADEPAADEAPSPKN